MTDPTLPPLRPSSLRYRLGVAAALLVAAIALVLGVRATQTDVDDPATVNSRPDVVEHLIPRSGAQVLYQAEVGIDLAPGHEGRLLLNGTPLPDDEVRRVPEQNQIFFSPAEGRTFTRLPEGRNCVTAIVWQSSLGPGTDDLSFRWCFEVH